jgi:ABC transport system ATP-binding/permease protein
MPLLSLRQINLAFGADKLFDNLDLVIEPRERLCLLGRNGEGKSSLMRVIAGLETADSGEINQQGSLQIAYLDQGVPGQLPGTVTQTLTNEHTESWEVEKWLSQLDLPPEELFEALSGGMKRRVLLAKALLLSPDLLLLDEPTNHLDIEAIIWLENFLANWHGTLLFVSHDRAFVQRLASRIIELDRGQLTSWPGDYQLYLKRKQAALEAEEKTAAEFGKKLAQEEVWIRQGIKARRTRNEGRVRKLQTMRKQQQQSRQLKGKANMRIQQSESSGKQVLTAKNLTFSHAEQPLVQNLSTTLVRGDRVGIIGPNGIGKTTLIRLLLGEITPDEGQVTLGTQLQVAYFDQHRQQLDLNKSVRDNVADEADHVMLDGRSQHVIGYLNNFLFSANRANSPVSTLSGGEKNRLLLARLFSKPFNLLVLDEPTNDLDMETLDLLEELLLNYAGTLLLISHDREFLNNVVTSTLVFESPGRVHEYVGGYDDWLEQRPKTGTPTKELPQNTQKTAKSQSKRAKKLSYKEQQELQRLPQQIEKLEKQLSSLQQRMADTDFFQQPQEQISTTSSQLEHTEQALTQAYKRWEALEEDTND